jgi:putative thioredoxin
MLAGDELDEARRLLLAMPARRGGRRSSRSSAPAKSALALAARRTGRGGRPRRRWKLPRSRRTRTTMQARFELAGAPDRRNGERDGAADNLLEIVEAVTASGRITPRGRKLLSLFEAVGLEDPWVAAQRRRLSLILFG